MNRLVQARLGLLVGAFLALPAARLWLSGDLDLTTAVVRGGVAMAVGLAGMAALGTLLAAYAPKASVAPGKADDIADAELVEPNGEEQPPPLL